MKFQIAGSLTAVLLAFMQSAAFSQESKYVRRDASKSIAIVFVHGVLGDSVSTWTNGSTKAYWPTLLANDSAFNGASVYVFQYPSPKVGMAYSINELAEVMRRRLVADGVFEHREIIFLSHSMGGLVTRLSCEVSSICFTGQVRVFSVNSHRGKPKRNPCGSS